jgi:hypothetical protein
MRKVSLLLALAISVVGCGRPEGPKTSVVTGEVTLDGAPLDEGAINFLPVDGNGVPSGAKISSGTYRADVPLGEKRVEIRAPKIVGQKDAYVGDPNSPKINIVEERIPLRYNAQSELRTKVSEKTPATNFPLQSGNQ